MTKRDLLTLLEKVPDDAPLGLYAVHQDGSIRFYGAIEVKEHGLLRGHRMLWLREVEG